MVTCTVVETDLQNPSVSRRLMQDPADDHLMVVEDAVPPYAPPIEVESSVQGVEQASSVLEFEIWVSGLVAVSGW